jgi:hypothetical protein
VESFKLLFDGKYAYYHENNGNRPLEVEYRRINNISNTFHINGLYYSLDHGNHHNIFDRVDRYDQKVKLILCFFYLTIFNIFEIVINIKLLIDKKPSLSYDKWQRILPGCLSVINILVTLALSTITVIKMKIATFSFY